MIQKSTHIENEQVIPELPNSSEPVVKWTSARWLLKSLMPRKGLIASRQTFFMLNVLLIWLGVVVLLVPSSAQAFFDNFNSTGQLEETDTLGHSPSSFYWLNSGAYFFQQFGLASTIQGRLPTNDPWRQEYSAPDYSADTDKGYHPQNLFRLLHKGLWFNYRQQVYFRVIRDNLSTSDERDAWNGLLLMNRYLDGDNLYYVGLRVDGKAIFKKKRHGEYDEDLTIEKKVLPGTYNRDTRPSLIPKFKWIGVRSEVTNNSDGSVLIKLFLDIGRTGNWGAPVITTTDTVEAISSKGHVGIRTDFMDVEFDNYSITNR